MFGFVTKEAHSQERSKTSTEKCEEKEFFFRDTPLLFAGSLFVNAHAEKTTEIHEESIYQEQYKIRFHSDILKNDVFIVNKEIEKSKQKVLAFLYGIQYNRECLYYKNRCACVGEKALQEGVYDVFIG